MHVIVVTGEVYSALCVSAVLAVSLVLPVHVLFLEDESSVCVVDLGNQLEAIWVHVGNDPDGGFLEDVHSFWLVMNDAMKEVKDRVQHHLHANKLLGVVHCCHQDHLLVGRSLDALGLEVLGSFNLVNVHVSLLIALSELFFINNAVKLRFDFVQ